jgi:RNA polymerase sigma factor (TIGR02999 family)
MKRTPPGEVTRLLQAWSEGDTAARDRLMAVVYAELRKRAGAHMARERAGHSWRPTDLVHETYLRLVSQETGWKNREQFFALAARIMRRVLVDHARERRAQKRGQPIRVTLVEDLPGTQPQEPDLLDLDEALEELSSQDERAARLVELRFFGGLTEPEAAQAIGVSQATAKRDWAMARAWLFRRLNRRIGPADTR